MVSFYQHFLSKQGDKALKTVRTILSDINSSYRTGKLETTAEPTQQLKTSRLTVRHQILNEEQAEVSDSTSTSRKATYEAKSLSARSASLCQIKPFRLNSSRVKIKLPRLIDSPSELMKASMKSTFSPFTYKIESSEGGTIEHGGNPFLVGAINHALMKVKIERTKSEAQLRDSLQTRESSVMPVASRPHTTSSMRQRSK